MLLRKDTGGCTVRGYTWENDGDAVEVPDVLGSELLLIRGAGFSVAEPGGKTVTEPAPAAKKAITEPAPAAKSPASEKKTAK